MSRIANYPVPVPPKVDITLGSGEIVVKGPLGTLTQKFGGDVEIQRYGDQLLCRARNGGTQAECLFPDDASWLDFAKNLYADALSAWPPTGAVKSSDFIKRFAKDVAVCLLDLENPFFPTDDAGSLWQRAVLIEAGEHRFRHNAYKPEHVKLAVDQFEAKLTLLL